MTKLTFSKRRPKQGLNPNFFLMYGQPKVGKSTVCSMIEGALLVDFKNEYNHLSGIIQEVHNMDDIANLVKNIEERDERFPVIVLDNASWLLEFVKPLAMQLYRQTPDGKNSNVRDIMDLPFGGGYLWMRVAFMKTIEKFQSLTDTLILVGHLKESLTLGLEGDLDLPGQLKNHVMKEADTVGRIYREDNKCILDFDGKKVIAQSRLPHLRGRQITIAEADGDGNIISYWEKIFINYNKH